MAIVVSERLLGAVDAILRRLPENTDYWPQDIGTLRIPIPDLNELRRARRDVR